MQHLSPTTKEELAAALAEAAAGQQTIELGGAFSKRPVGGPIAPAEVVISTAALKRVLLYEPRDLTISVEAGMPYRELEALLAQNQQMIPLDPPFANEGTIGGVLAANLSGPRRRLFGTARDLTIGMTFATLEGKLVQSGGMVVKNVAGLDMAKLMIGSYGTLAAMASINFKLVPRPEGMRTFVYRCASTEAVFAQRDRLAQMPLQPVAVDSVNAAAAPYVGERGHLLLIRAAGSPAVLRRYADVLSDAEPVEEDVALWQRVQEFVPSYLKQEPEGAVVRVSSTLAGLPHALATLTGPVVSRAATGVAYACFPSASDAERWLRQSPERKAVIEYGPSDAKKGLTQWPAPGTDFAIMERVKTMFDPQRLLNPGRLYGRL